MVRLHSVNDLPIVKLRNNVERGILKQISETYGAKVEASAQDQAIRITSDYETSLDILRLIIHTLKNIKSAVVEFSSEYKPDLQASNSQKEIYMTILRHVMQSTNTIVRAKSSDELDQEVSIMMFDLLLTTNCFSAYSLLSWARRE